MRGILWCTARLLIVYNYSQWSPVKGKTCRVSYFLYLYFSFLGGIHGFWTPMTQYSMMYCFDSPYPNTVFKERQIFWEHSTSFDLFLFLGRGVGKVITPKSSHIPLPVWIYHLQCWICSGLFWGLVKQRCNRPDYCDSLVSLIQSKNCRVNIILIC